MQICNTCNFLVKNQKFTIKNTSQVGITFVFIINNNNNNNK